MTMTEHPELEEAVSTALRRLPSPHAPATLVPRIMMAVRQQAARPWYERAWLTWPLEWQTASAVVFIGISAGLVAWLSAMDAAAGGEMLRIASDWRHRLSSGLSPAAAVLDAVSVLWRVLVQPAAGCLVALVVAASMTCAATGAVIAHVSTERMPRT